ncbi:hypothetical protein SH449x_000672 [Pirellulaceae bacterium SH449]
MRFVYVVVLGVFLGCGGSTEATKNAPVLERPPQPSAGGSDSMSSDSL